MPKTIKIRESSISRTAEKILSPLSQWNHRCHEASLHLVKYGIGYRVARGTCSGVFGQHSWAVVGDCYNPMYIIDPTLWSYRKDVIGVFVGNAEQYQHVPHGQGLIWDYGKPCTRGGKPIPLDCKNLSKAAKSFLALLGPLDYAGWMTLANAPIGGWPASEIIEAMYRADKLRATVPIDRVGMLTDCNPGGLYMKA